MLSKLVFDEVCVYISIAKESSEDADLAMGEVSLAGSVTSEYKNQKVNASLCRFSVRSYPLMPCLLDSVIIHLLEVRDSQHPYFRQA